MSLIPGQVVLDTRVLYGTYRLFSPWEQMARLGVVHDARDDATISVACQDVASKLQLFLR
jgi:hypothetical protein